MTDEILADFLALFNPEVRELVIKTRALILNTIPGVMEIVDRPSRIVAYGYSRKYADLVCAIAPFNAYINLMFSRGTEIPDPDGLLTGTGKRARHVRIVHLNDTQFSGVSELIKAAAELIQQSSQ